MQRHRRNDPMMPAKSGPTEDGAGNPIQRKLAGMSFAEGEAALAPRESVQMKEPKKASGKASGGGAKASGGKASGGKASGGKAAAPAKPPESKSGGKASGKRAS